MYKSIHIYVLECSNLLTLCTIFSVSQYPHIIYVQNKTSHTLYNSVSGVLNLRGERTRRGKDWTDVAVRRVCKRLGIGKS